MTLPDGLTLDAIDVRALDEETLLAFHAFSEVLRAERSPDDPAVALEQFRTNFLTIPSFVDVRAWLVRDPTGRVVGEGHAAFMRLDQNRHVAEMSVEVLPGLRRQGVGRALLTEIARTVRAEGRTLVITNSSDRVPGGEAALARLGAEAGLAQHVNQLVLADLDRGLLANWTERASERAGDYELGLLEGPFPEERLREFGDMLHVMNSAPRGDLQIDDWVADETMLRAMNDQFAASGRRRLLVYAQHRETSRLVGYSELSWHPARPEIVSQSGTGVRPETRGLGLGRWLKAENLRLLLERNPEARFVRTTNADVNAAMLGINTALGFAPYSATVTWQVPLERVESYLAHSAATTA